MDTNLLSHVARLSDRDLLTQVKDLAQREREATVALIAHLAELDERRLYLAEGYPSLFKYCTDVLHLSEHATYNRIETARVVRRFPVLLEHLAAGWLNLFAVRLLAPHLTSENHSEALALAQHKSRRELEEIIARLRPQPPVPDVVRKLPSRLVVMLSRLPCRRLKSRRRHLRLPRRRRGARLSGRSRPSVTKSNSRPARPCTRSCERRRRCCGIRFRTAISRKCLIGRWRR